MKRIFKQTLSIIMAISMLISSACFSGSVFGVDVEMMGLNDTTDESLNESTKDSIIDDSDNNDSSNVDLDNDDLDISNTLDEDSSDLSSDTFSNNDNFVGAYDDYLGLSDIVKFSSPLIGATASTNSVGAVNAIEDIDFYEDDDNDYVLQIIGTVTSFSDDGLIGGVLVTVELWSENKRDETGATSTRVLNYSFRPTAKSGLKEYNRFNEKISIKSQDFAGTKGGNYFVFVQFDTAGFGNSVGRVNIDSGAPVIESIEVTPYTQGVLGDADYIPRNSNGSYSHFKVQATMYDNFLLNGGHYTLKISSNNNKNVNILNSYIIAEKSRVNYDLNGDVGQIISGHLVNSNDGQRFQLEYVVEAEKVDPTATGFVCEMYLYDNVGLTCREKKTADYYDLEYMYTADMGSDEVYITNRDVTKAVTAVEDQTSANGMSTEFKDISLDSNAHVNSDNQYWKLERVKNEEDDEDFYCYNLISSGPNGGYLSSLNKSPESFDETELLESAIYDTLNKNTIMYNDHKYVLYPLEYVTDANGKATLPTAYRNAITANLFTAEDGPIYKNFADMDRWEMLQAFCMSVGGHLATFTSEAEWNYVRDYLIDPEEEKVKAEKNDSTYFLRAYMGGRRVDTLNGTNITSMKWEWITGEEWKTTDFAYPIATSVRPWGEREPISINATNTSHKQYNEKYITTWRTYPDIDNVNTWNDYSSDSDDVAYFICEIDNVQTFYNGHRYVYYPLPENGSKTDWFYLKEYCESLGGHLATFTSRDEWKHVRDNILVPNNCPQVFLGGYCGAADPVPNYEWKWVTGEQWTFGPTNPVGSYPWSSADPDYQIQVGVVEAHLGVQNESTLFGDKESCVWNDYSYNSMVVGGFICEFDNFESSYDGNSYVICTSRMTWTEAKAFCESKGGHLATFDTQGEWVSVRDNLLAKNGNISCWFGGYKDGTKWKWANNKEWLDTDFGYPKVQGAFPWNPSEPSGGTQAYLATDYYEEYNSSFWSDFDNNGNGTVVAFICEFEFKVNKYVKYEYTVTKDEAQQFVFYKAPSGEGTNPGVGECYYIRERDDYETLLSLWVVNGKYELYGSIYQKFKEDNENNSMDNYKFTIVRQIEDKLYDDIVYSNYNLEGLSTVQQRRTHWFSIGRYNYDNYSPGIFFDYCAFEKYNPELAEEEKNIGDTFCPITGNTLTVNYRMYYDYIYTVMLNGLRASPVFDLNYFIQYYTEIKEMYDDAVSRNESGYGVVVKFLIDKFYDDPDYFVETAGDFSVIAYRKYNPQAKISEYDNTYNNKNENCSSIKDYLRHYWVNSYDFWNEDHTVRSDGQDRIYNYVSYYLPNYQIEFTYDSKIQGKDTKYIVNGQFDDKDLDMDTSQLFEGEEGTAQYYARFSKIKDNNASYVNLTAKLVSKKIPYIDNVSNVLNWEIFDNDDVPNEVLVDESDADNSTLVKTISPIGNGTRYVIVTALEKSGNNYVYFNNISGSLIKYGSTVKKENLKNYTSSDGAGYIYSAPETKGNNVFSYWQIYEADTSTGEIKPGKEIAKCYERDFSLAVFDNVVIVPIYSGYSQSSDYSTSLQYLGTGRNQWTGTRDPNTGEYVPNSSGVFIPVDKVFANFVLTFNHKDNMLNTVPTEQNGTGKYVKCGVMLEVCGNAKVDSSGQYITDASEYTSSDGNAYKYKTDKANYENALKQVILNSKSSGFTTKNLTNTKYGTQILNYSISTAKLDNKNKLEYYLAFNNSDNNQKKMMRAYSYMVVDGNYDGDFDDTADGTDFVVLCDTPYEFVNFINIGNSSYI